jgi:hypothetical protein
MHVYSKNIIRFVTDIKRAIKQILTNEVGLAIHGDRFYDRAKRNSYPLKVVAYNNKSLLGYFDPNFYELGFHECLMRSSKQQLEQVVRHELAHYMAHINFGTDILPHGVEFKAFCQSMGWGEDVQRASFCLEGGDEAAGVEESGVLRKVQKLMALASSSNKNEAEQAMIKSQQLLLKHNIETKYLDGEDEEKIYLKRILQQKKKSAKMHCIAIILETFFVSTVYNRTQEFTCLEIMGNAVNIEIAEYVANFLVIDLEKLWIQTQRQTRLKGSIAKNSFFLGLAKGYCDKIQALKREYDKDVSNALLVIEKKLVDAKEMVYKRLTNTRSNGQYCPESSALGERAGRQLSINPALSRAPTQATALIVY